MKISVLGGGGFVGPHVVRKLLELGADVEVYENWERGSTRVVGNSWASQRRVTYKTGIVDSWLNNLDSLSLGDMVLNLAASVGGIYYNQSHQLLQFAKNCMLQTIPVVAAEYAGVESFLQVSSVCVYDPQYQYPGKGVTEDMGMLGSPHPANYGYAMGKRVGEEVLRASNIPHSVIVRPSNIAGPGDYFDDKAHVIPALIKRAVDTRKLIVYGNPEYVREFIHVEDVAEGMIFAALNGKGGETYNLGSGQIITIEELAYLIRDITGIKEIQFAGGEGGDPWRKSNTQKINDLGWKAKRSVEQIVEDAYKWYLKISQS